MRKLFWTETIQRHYSDALDILGAEGVLAPDAANAPGGGTFEHDFRAAVVTTVYGGASEILREIIAERRSACRATGPAAEMAAQVHLGGSTSAAVCSAQISDRAWAALRHSPGKLR